MTITVGQKYRGELTKDIFTVVGFKTNGNPIIEGIDGRVTTTSHTEQSFLNMFTLIKPKIKCYVVKYIHSINNYHFIAYIETSWNSMDVPKIIGYISHQVIEFEDN